MFLTLLEKKFQEILIFYPYIEADSAELNQPKYARYEGNVDIKQGNRHLKTEIADIKQTGIGEGVQRYAYVAGGFHYSDDLINLSGDNGKLHLNTKNAEILPM